MGHVSPHECLLQGTEDRSFKHACKSLSTNQEQIRRDRVPLPDTPSWGERRRKHTIHLNRERDRGQTLKEREGIDMDGGNMIPLFSLEYPTILEKNKYTL
jgi:hypothetical protein